MQKIILGLLIALILFTIYYTYYIVPRKNTNLYGLDSVSGRRGKVGLEEFTNGASIDYKMGEYSNIILDKDDKIKYNELYYMKSGTRELIEIPQPCDSFSCLNKVAPSVDGCKSSVKSGAMFRFNRSAPECCPSTYSTSSGCVCLTPEQQNYISSNRGNNNT